MLAPGHAPVVQFEGEHSMSLRLTTTSFVVTIVVAAGLPAEEPKGTSAESFIKQWVSAVNKSPENLLAFYDRSEETEVIVSSGVRFRGYQAIQRAYNEAFREVRHSDSIAKEVRSRRVGDTAIVTFEHLLKIHVAADDSRWQIHVRTTSVLHRFEDTWKIVHEHSSPIRDIERMTRIQD